MLGLTESTPTYKGKGQPQSGSGGFLDGIFGYLFGGTTPGYQGNGQPTTTQGGWLGSLFSSSTPAYKPVPPTVTQSPPPGTAEAIAPDDGSTPPNGTPPQVYICIP